MATENILTGDDLLREVTRHAGRPPERAWCLACHGGRREWPHIMVSGDEPMTGWVHVSWLPRDHKAEAWVAELQLALGRHGIECQSYLSSFRGPTLHLRFRVPA